MALLIAGEAPRRRQVGHPHEVVDAEIWEARANAISVAKGDRRWSEAIARRMQAGSSAGDALPSLREIEANAHLGATTTSMRIGWQIAVDAGLIGARDCKVLIASQVATIDAVLAAATCPPDAHETLAEMRAEYRYQLDRNLLLAVNGSSS